MEVRQNALAIYDLLMAYQDITLEDAQRRLHLSEEELEGGCLLPSSVLFPIKTNDAQV